MARKSRPTADLDLILARVIKDLRKHLESVRKGEEQSCEVTYIVTPYGLKGWHVHTYQDADERAPHD